MARGLHCERSVLIPNRLRTLRSYLNAAIGAAASAHELVLGLSKNRAFHEYPRGLAYVQALEPRIYAFRDDLEQALERLGASKSTLLERAGSWAGTLTAWLEGLRSEEEVALQLRDFYVGISALLAQSRCAAIVASRLGDAQTAETLRRYADEFGSACEELRSIVDEILARELIDEGKVIPRSSDRAASADATETVRRSSIDFESARLDPAGAFDSPQAVLNAPGFSREQRLEILRRWEYDARELQVAEAENMGGGEPARLDEVHRALHALDAEGETRSPTQHGGG